MEGPPLQREETRAPRGRVQAPGLSPPLHGWTPETLWKDSWPQGGGVAPGLGALAELAGPREGQRRPS